MRVKVSLTRSLIDNNFDRRASPFRCPVAIGLVQQHGFVKDTFMIGGYGQLSLRGGPKPRYPIVVGQAEYDRMMSDDVSYLRPDLIAPFEIEYELTEEVYAAFKSASQP